jgi:hypothetical protein
MMWRRLALAAAVSLGATGLVLAADYKKAVFKEGLGDGKVIPGKVQPNARFEYEFTDPKTKKTETKTVDVMLSLGYTTAGWLDEKGKRIPVEKIIDYNKPGLVADIKTEKRKDGVEYVVGLKVVKAPDKEEKKT